MALWPFCPAPVVTETLAWLTETLNPYSTQQAASLRVAPRQGFTFDHPFSFREYERAQLLMEYAAHGDWDLPVWPERQRITVGSGVSVLSVDTTTSDYREGGKCLLWQSSEACEAIEIDALTATTITLATPTSRAYTNGFVAPVVTARCVNGLKSRRDVQPYQPASVEWMVYDSVDLAEEGSTTLYPFYRSYPVITDAPCVGGDSLEMGVSRELDIIDNATGLPYFDTALGRVSRPLGMGWSVNTAAELWALRRFLHGLRGRQKAFWLPSWNNGLQLAASIVPASTTVSLLAVGLNGVAETGDLMVVSAGGSKSYHRYTAVAPSGNNEVLTLSAAAGVTVSSDSDPRICRMHLCRQAADLVQLRHVHTGRRQVTTVMIRADEVPIP